MNKLYDTIIIGSGVTGLAAGMYAGRLGMKTLVIGEAPGGTITLTNVVENYPGFKKITGQELADNIKEHALDYKEFVELKDGRVTKIERKNEKEAFTLFLEEEVVYGKTIIFATGTKWKELKVPGHDEFRNKGVHYCALCDGFFYRNKIAAVVGGSDSAVKDALVLAEHAKKVYLIIRGDQLKAEPINIKRVGNNEKIEVVTNTNIIKITGDEKGVTKVILDKPYNGNNELELEGIFIAIGHIALSDLAKTLNVTLNEKGEIKINRNAETNIPGVYAAGDVTDSHFKQAITGVSEGVTAAHSVYEYVTSIEIGFSK